MKAESLRYAISYATPSRLLLAKQGVFALRFATTTQPGPLLFFPFFWEQ
jgi:hypothetical protein